MLAGREIDLQEHTPPRQWRQQDIEVLNETVTSREGSWTKLHLEHHIHVAREALALVKEAKGAKIERAVSRVEASLKRAVDHDGGNPNDDCPNISNRTKELLDTLQQPGIKQISSIEFKRYMEQLIKIAKMV